jgi:hypothetical protein
LDEGVEAADFGCRDSFAETSEPIIAPALVGARRVGTFGQFFDQALLEHAADGTVKSSGAQLDLALGPGCDILHDGVAMTVAIGERDQDMEDGRWERQERVWVIHFDYIWD